MKKIAPDSSDGGGWRAGVRGVAVFTVDLRLGRCQGDRRGGGDTHAGGGWGDGVGDDGAPAVERAVFLHGADGVDREDGAGVGDGERNVVGEVRDALWCGVSVA